MVFLHPAQRDLVTKQFTGPARVAGSAGTGKTVVALHRAAQAARAHPGARVLLTTFNAALAGALQAKMDLLLSGEPRLRERIEVRTLDHVALAILGGMDSTLRIASPNDIAEATSIACAEAPPQTFSEDFIRSEWLDVIDEWQLATWDDYRDVQRLGRKKGLREEQRAALWDVFQAIETDLAAKRLTTMPRTYASAADALAGRPSSPFDFVIVDEAQDVSVAQLRFIAALTREHPERLFFAGDLGQRIFQTPFSWKALGVDVRGRSRTLRVNYRTSHEIRRVADKLLPPEMSDVDGNSESRRGTVSVFTGAPPQLVVAASNGEEETVVGTWAAALAVDGTEPEEIAVFVRSDQELDRARAAVVAAGLTAEHLDPHAPLSRGAVAIGTMEQAKGLEFRAVAVMACDDEVIPSQARIDEIGDYADLEDVWETERQLLYVACTRARDQLLVTGVAPGSEFLDDLRG